MKHLFKLTVIILIGVLLVSCHNTDRPIASITTNSSTYTKIPTQTPLPTFKYDINSAESLKQFLVDMDTCIRQLREVDMTKPIEISEGNIWYPLKNVSSMDELKNKLEDFVGGPIEGIISMYEIAEKDGIPIYNPDNKQGRYYFDFNNKVNIRSSVGAYISLEVPLIYVGANNDYPSTDTDVFMLSLKNNQIRYGGDTQWLNTYIFAHFGIKNYDITPITVSKEEIDKWMNGE